MRSSDSLVEVHVAPAVPVVDVPDPPAVTVHVAVMVVVVTMVMMTMVVMTVVVMVVTVMMVTVGAVSSRGTSRERRQAERDGSSQSEHCGASEHGLSFLELRVVHPQY